MGQEMGNRRDDGKEMRKGGEGRRKAWKGKFPTTSILL